MQSIKDLPTSSIPNPGAAALSAVDTAHAALQINPVLDIPKLDQYWAQHRHRLAQDLTWVGPADGRKILEIGSHPGLLTVALKQAGHAIAVVDFAEDFPAPYEVSIARCNIETEPMPFEDDTFDLILFNEVFEHLRIDLFFTLKEILRVLKPGGTLHLSTPNLRSLRGAKELFLNGRGACA